METIKEYMKKLKLENEKQDPDWQYKSILKGAFSGCSKTDKDVLGTRDDAEYTTQ